LKYTISGRHFLAFLVLSTILTTILIQSPVAHAQNIFNKTTVGSAYNQAKNTSMSIANQAPDALKGAYNQAKNTSIEFVNQAKNLIKNDTNSSKLLNQLEQDFGRLIGQFSNLISK
jgi:hypothetical protein